MNDSGFVDHCLELLSPLGPTRAHRMFGGQGLYVGELCVALIFRDSLYLKVDEPNRAAFEAAGCRPFVYETRNGETGSLRYFTAPEEAMESPHEMRPWARRAIAAALAARAKAAPKKAAQASSGATAPAKSAGKETARKKVAAKSPAPAEPPTKTAAKKTSAATKRTPAPRSRRAAP
jgi:DNA transformation protein